MSDADRIQALHARQVTIIQQLSQLMKRTGALQKSARKPPIGAATSKKQKRLDTGASVIPCFQYSKPSKSAQETIESFLYRRFPYHSLEQWQKFIDGGCIHINGSVASRGAILQTNDMVAYHKVLKEPPVDAAFKVLYSDDHIIVVSKSGNIPVTEGGMYYTNTLVHAVRQHLQSGVPSGSMLVELYSVHRLDRETSGIVVFTRTTEAGQALSMAFASNAVHKVYYAVLVGHLAEPTTCALPITEQWRIQEQPTEVPDAKQVSRLRMTCHPAGKEACTSFEPLAWAEGMTLCRVKPLTGRTHQIRVHAHTIGHPIVGDKLYGQPDDRFLTLTRGTEPPDFPPFGLVPRHQLHAGHLSFPHPATGKEMHFFAPPHESLCDCPHVVAHFGTALASVQDTIDCEQEPLCAT